jgi:hypothetical protein
MTDASGRVVSMVGEWERRHWGDGGAEFHWWCTEAPEAFGAKRPVYETMRDELTEMVGKKVYAKLAAYLGERRSESWVPLPHPAIRRKKRG